MSPQPAPELEEKRLQTLREYQILDTPAEESFDELTRLACYICQSEIGFVSFVDSRRQWNKSCQGWEIAEIPREHSFCAHVIVQPALMVVEDATSDPRFKNNPYVIGEPHIRFYAGAPLPTRFIAAAPLVSPEGIAIGALCVMDKRPRKLTAEQASALETLSKQVVNQLELRRNVADLNAKQEATELALRHSEAFYHSLVETLPHNIFRKNLQGQFTFANSRFCAVVGKPREQILGKTDFDLFPRELAEKYHQDDAKALASKSVFKTIEKHQSPDGTMLYVQVIKTPLYDLAGNVNGLQGIFWDETERYKAEEELAHERYLLRAMLENIPDSIYFKDRNSRFLACSRALANRLGLKDPDEAIGKTDLDFFDSIHARQALEDEQRIIATGEPMIAKSEMETWRDGTTRWVLTTKVPLRNPRGETIGTLGISKDITELKQTEAALADARDSALETARLKSEFLANMSHEIRTPLNAVIGMTGLLLDTPLNQEQKDFAETIRNSADTLLNIINDILDFSKMEAGKLSIESIDFDVADLVESTVELLATPAQAKDLELVCWISEHTPRYLRGDPGRLRQILLNLVGNAVKFTERGEVVVSLSSEERPDGTINALFKVKDTGIGIPVESQGRLFEAFTQADGSTTRRYGGSGLGLAISKQLIELMGGEIGFESVPKKGSTFWFKVPLEKQVAPPPLQLTANILQGVRVLVVDDNETNRQIIHHQVLSWKMRNGTAGSGADALRRLKEASASGDPYSLVILDMQMPGMDGLALAKAIRSQPDLNNLRMVMLTSLGHLPEERLWKECGISAYLIKPVKQTRLFETLISVMHGAAFPSSKIEAQGPARSSGDTNRLRNVRILVAEDNAVNQKVALRQLQKLGYTADAVANGVEVLDALRKIPYHLILMDCQMPELDGYEATRRLRALEQTGRAGKVPSHYIIAMTANALAGDREECLASGMNDYISKPVRIHELQAAIERGLAFVEKRAEAGKSGEVALTLVDPKFQSLDPTILQGLEELESGQDTGLIVELIDLFLRDAPALVEALEKGAASKELGAIERPAHALKGSSANLGASRLSEICRKIVQKVRGSEQPERALISEVRTEFEKLKPMLEDIKRARGKSVE